MNNVNSVDELIDVLMQCWGHCGKPDFEAFKQGFLAALSGAGFLTHEQCQAVHDELKRHVLAGYHTETVQ